jgi:hypothetical protein
MDDELRAIPIRMAEQVRELLPAVTLERYQRFLDHMFHYTHGSGPRLEHAAAHAATDGQRAYFAELARDEAHHYRLAELDLAAFGRTPTATPPPAVAEFDARWRGWAAPGWIGALHALESVAEHLAPDAQRHLGRLGLGRDQARFVLVHLTADVGHGALTAAQLDAALERDRVATLAAARSAADFWVGLHFDAFA